MAGIRKTIGENYAQHRHLRQDMRGDQHDHYEEVHNHEKEERDLDEPSFLWLTLKFDAPPSFEERIKGKLNGVAINQGYVQFDDFSELDNLKNILLAKPDLPCPTNAIFHIFGEYNDREMYLVHRVYICSDLDPPVDVDKTCKLERYVIANHSTSSFCSFDWMKLVVSNGLHDEQHMEKPRTVFHEEGEDDVIMPTMDTTISHIKDQQEDITIK
uniref:OSJNBa0013A04.16 protein n=1 Tax=Oryza sativa subsp. japonica TaxID=39947 RepID=Q7XLF3_ORYSJ|nr:OSJNBa0013A04.16 [Oryza sativa Japonica Group]